LPTDTLSPGRSIPLDAPDSVVPPLGPEDERDARCARPDHPAEALPVPALIHNREFEVRASSLGGAGLFALADIPAGRAITRYAGALSDKVHYRHVAHMRGDPEAAARYPDLNLGTHCKTVPGTSAVIDAAQLSRRAAVGPLPLPSDEPWAERGLAGLINSSRFSGAPPNARFLWYGDACYAVTTRLVPKDQEILVNYVW